jgi:hypothetical protein
MPRFLGRGIGAYSGYQAFRLARNMAPNDYFIDFFEDNLLIVKRIA